MTLTIELTSELEKRLLQESTRRGVEPRECVKQLLADTLPQPQIRGAQALAFWRQEGVLGSYGDPNLNADELARELRRQAETRGQDTSRG